MPMPNKPLSTTDRLISFLSGAAVIVAFAVGLLIFALPAIRELAGNHDASDHMERQRREHERQMLDPRNADKHSLKNWRPVEPPATRAGTSLDYPAGFPY